MDPISIMLILGIVSAFVSGGSAIANTISQNNTNASNIQMQKETNAQQQYNLEHAHQIEMKDLTEAGLNPVLTATGGSGATSTTSIQAPQAKAPQLDLSGVSSALSSMTSMMMMMHMMDMKKDIADLRTDAYNHRTDLYFGSRGGRSVNGSDILRNMEKGRAAYNSAGSIESAKDVNRLIRKMGLHFKNPKDLENFIKRYSKR